MVFKTNTDRKHSLTDSAKNLEASQTGENASFFCCPALGQRKPTAMNTRHLEAKFHGLRCRSADLFGLWNSEHKAVGLPAIVNCLFLSLR
jgi:hypothetical protein